MTLHPEFVEAFQAASSSYLRLQSPSEPSTMSTSQFDPQAFLDMTLDTPLVKRPPLPVGDYRGVIGEVASREWVSKDQTKTGIAWDVPISLEVPANIQAELGLSQATLPVKDSIMLDLNDQGHLDGSPGKNSKLRKYREALDMNKPGDSFSARQMQGRPVLVKIKHEEYQGDLYERVDGVARA